MTGRIENFLNRAFELHKLGKFEEARFLYEKIIQIDTNNVEALNLYAQLLIQYKEFDNAITIFEKVFEITKSESIMYEIAKVYFFKGDYNSSLNFLNSIKLKSIDVYNLIVNISLKIGDINSAINSNLEILKINPKLYDVIYNLSILYSNIDQIDTSLKFALDAYQIKNNDVNLLFHISSLYDKKNDKLTMLEYLEKILMLSPNNEILLSKMGLEYTLVKNQKKAVACYEKCLKINEYNYNALVNLAVLLIDIKQYDYAIDLCNKALKVQPNNIRGYHSLFLIYSAMQNPDKAQEIAKNMIHIAPDNHLGYGCLGDVYFEYVDYKKALESYNIALSLSPNDLDYLYNKAYCLNILNNVQETFEIIDKILSIDANYFQAILLKTFMYLKRKNYSKAMETYPFIVRPDVKLIINSPKYSNSTVNERVKQYYKKHWDREDLTNKTLLLYNNDGYGDSIMFSRYIPFLEKKAKKLIIETDKNLYDLYKYNFKNSQVILETDEPIKGYDYTVSSMELLYAVNTDFKNIPFSEGWLNIPNDKIQKFDFSTNKLNVGLFWQGNKKILKNRAVKLSDFIPLFELSDIQFYSLDITDKDDYTINLFEKYNIFDCKPFISNYCDTASIMKNLDLVISIDSSVVHLAGAFAIKTFLLLPKCSEWRWFNDYVVTTWYDSVRIFKQKTQSDWNEVILRIKKELQ